MAASLGVHVQDIDNALNNAFSQRQISYIYTQRNQYVIVLETDPSDFMRRGGVGTVSWPGAFGGWWQADPKDGSVLIFLAHNMVDLGQMAKGIGLGVWAAIEAFSTR